MEADIIYSTGHWIGKIPIPNPSLQAAETRLGGDEKMAFLGFMRKMLMLKLVREDLFLLFATIKTKGPRTLLYQRQPYNPRRQDEFRYKENFLVLGAGANPRAERHSVEPRCCIDEPRNR